MTTASIPDWTSDGLLPPHDAAQPTSLARSPYHASMSEFVLRFATSDERCAILEGALRFRGALREAGIDRGFQWINGSFAEDIESIEGRPPNDTDIVTFFHLPNGETQKDFLTSHKTLFDRASSKTNFSVDAYFVVLDADGSSLVKQSAYWYSVWAHRRDLAWKGYVSVELQSDDTEAAQILTGIRQAGFQQ